MLFNSTRPLVVLAFFLLHNTFAFSQVSISRDILLCPGEVLNLFGVTYNTSDTTTIVLSGVPPAPDTLVTYRIRVLDNVANAQGCDCHPATFFKTFGRENETELGAALARSSDNNLYMAGRKNGKTFIQKMNLSGEVIWLREFSVSNFEPITPIEIIEDSDGMITGCGIQGIVTGLRKGFIFRYNPETNAFLWTRSISSNDPTAAGILENGSGGNYIYYQNPNLSGGETDAEVLEIERNTGNIVPSFAHRYEYKKSDVLSKLLFRDGALYGTGWSSGLVGSPDASRRQLLTKLNAVDGTPVWSRISHVDTSGVGDFFGRDVVADGDAIVAAYDGDDFTNQYSGTTGVFLEKTDLNGQVLWLKRYALQGKVLKLLSVSDGYVVYGQVGINDWYIVKTDKNGVLIWAKGMAFGPGGVLSNAGYGPAQALEVDGSLFFTGITPTINKDLFLLKINADGSFSDSCNYLHPIDVLYDFVEDAKHYPISLTEKISTAAGTANDVPWQVSNLFEQLLCPDCVAPNPCPAGNDFVIDLTASPCSGGTVNLNLSICDLDGGALPPTIKVSFYNANPTTSAAQDLGDYEFNTGSSDSCFSYTLLDLAGEFGAAATQNGFQIFAVVNYDGVLNTPFSFADFPVTDLEECNYTNNLDSFTVQLPAAPSLDLGPDQSICIGETAILTPGPVFFKYKWSNGSDNDTIFVNQSGLFSLTVTDACGFKQSDAVGVQVKSMPNLIKTGTICPNSTTVIDGQLFTHSGAFQDTIPSTNGASCDTIVTYLITQLPYVMREEQVDFCKTITINGVLHDESGVERDTFPGVIGCDTIVLYFLNQLPKPFRFDTAFICPGGSVTINGVVYTQAGLAIDTIPSADGIACDTLLRTQIIVLPQVVIDQSIAFCQGGSAVVNGQIYTQPDTITILVPGNGSDCDTLINYALSWLPTPTRSELVGFCPGSSVVINGQTYTQPGTVTYTVPGVSGQCDTLVTYTIVLFPAPTRSELVEFCPGTSVVIDGQTYTQPSTVIGTIPGVSGECDTVVTYTLTFLPSPTRLELVEFCPGTSVTIGGQTYTQAGIVTDTIPALSGGCDTVVTYTLSLLPAPTRSELVEFCPGTSVTIGGQTYTQPGTVTGTIPSINGGCDTLVTYTLNLLPTPTRSESVEFCPGTSVVIDGQTYTQAGTVTGTVPGLNGACDTLVTYTLSLLPTPTRAELVEFCPGKSVVIGGQTYTQPGIVTGTIAGNNGACDTLVTYTLAFLPTPTKSELVEFCPGGSVVIGGTTYTQPGTATGTVPGLNGACDTLVTYTLQYLTPPPANISLVCPPNVTVSTTPGSGGANVTYSAPTATTDCTCPGVTLQLTSGNASGSLFPTGVSNVCYSATDLCNDSATCCFTVSVSDELPCDTKINGCIRYDLLGITSDASGQYTYKIRVTNNCSNKLIYTAIQIPNGINAVSPVNNTTFITPEGRSYAVRTPNAAPFYSIRFKSTTDSIANGQTATFTYTLPAQTHPTFIDITSRLAPQVFYEAHLNVFECPVGITPGQNRNDGFENPDVTLLESGLRLFPNPTSGELFADLSRWSGQSLHVRVLNGMGQSVKEIKLQADQDAQAIELPAQLASGLYFLEVRTEDGRREVGSFVVSKQ